MISDASGRDLPAGRAARRPRDVVEGCPALDVLALTRLGVVGAGACGMAEFTWLRPGPPLRVRARVWFPLAASARLTVTYADPGTGRRAAEEFALTTTAPRLGGLRWWVECACGRSFDVF